MGSNYKSTMFENSSINPAEPAENYIRQVITETKTITEEIEEKLEQQEELPKEIETDSTYLPELTGTETEDTDLLTETWFKKTNPLWLSSDRNPVETFLSYDIQDKVTASRTEIYAENHLTDLYLELNLYLEETGVELYAEFTGNSTSTPANNNIKRALGDLINGETERYDIELKDCPKDYESESEFFDSVLTH